jgi:aspartate 1-decarboxylase
MIEFLRAKIHRATITEANPDYMGSISISEELLKASGIREFEKVLVGDITNGERLETYVIKGKPGQICLNGAAAKKIRAGDLVIIMAFQFLEEGQEPKPKIILVDEKNRFVRELKV